MTHTVHTRIDGPLVMIGFGSIGRGTLPLIERHIGFDRTAFSVIEPSGDFAHILQEHGNYSWLTEKGEFVILNNGIEFGVTYLLMLFTLLFTGGGRFTSVDYFLSRLWPDRS